MKRLGALIVIVLLALAAPAVAQDHPLRGVALVIGAVATIPARCPSSPTPRTTRGRWMSCSAIWVSTSPACWMATAASLAREIEDFVDAAKDADVALVYYSGHGIEAGGENYLVPVDADLSTPEKAGATLIPLSALLDELAKTVPVTIVLLDACRTERVPGWNDDSATWRAGADPGAPRTGWRSAGADAGGAAEHAAEQPRHGHWLCGRARPAGARRRPGRAIRLTPRRC